MNTPASSTSSAEGQSLADSLGYLGFLLGGGFLCLQAGMLLAVVESPLYQMTRDGVTAATALVAEYQMRNEELPFWLWSAERQPDKGLVKAVPEKMSPGFTLYSSGHTSAVMALDQQGQEVFRWEVPFSKLWPRPQHIARGVPDNAIYIRRFHPFPNGDLLALYETPTTSPNGRGLAKIDRNGNALWTYDACTHHDLTVGADGRIYTLTHDIRTEAHPAFHGMGRAQIEEFVVVLSPAGEELQKLSLFDLLGKSEYFRPETTRADDRGDILHSNTVSLVNEGFAREYGLAAGNLMVCLRNINLAIVIDLEQQQIVWGTTGPWCFPHDTTPMDDGTILAFDNAFTVGTKVLSRVVQFHPRTSAVTWSFTEADGSLPLVSQVRSCQQRLSNGNTLITESDHGRLLEVSADGELVWEFVNPVRAGKDRVMTPIISGATRYTADELPFLAMTEQLAHRPVQSTR